MEAYIYLIGIWFVLVMGLRCMYDARFGEEDERNNNLTIV